MQLSDKRLLNYSQRLRRLRFLAIALLLFLTMPLGTLLYYGFQQIENNLLTEYQNEARSLIQVTDRNLFKRRMLTNTLPVEGFDYYQQVFNPITKQPQQVLSSLSQQGLNKATSKSIQGLVGYFQYNSQGDFNSPLWPNSLSEDDVVKIQKRDSGLNLNLNLNINTELIIRKQAALKVYQILSQSKSLKQILQQPLIVDKLLFNVFFDVPGYLIFYRIVSVSHENRLQGYLVERKPYLYKLFIDLVEQRRFDSPMLIELKDSKYSNRTEYFFYQRLPDEQVKVAHSLKLDTHYQQQPIYESKLRWPYDGYTISLSTSYLPITPVMMHSGIFITILIAAILFACYGFYRLGIRQLVLGEQRLNFVSSVSHELKTPLTSIQMYSQMLIEETMISKAYKKDYYHFIYNESERLTRLINNILQLSKLSNQQHNVQPNYTQLTVLQDIISSKISSIMIKNGFQQNIDLEIDDPEDVLVFIDKDSFTQVIINITDNSLKFFDKGNNDESWRQKIDFVFRNHPKDKNLIQLEIRDYGDGITLKQKNKLFDLFYRGSNELTRTTQGTGIGLALVKELVLAQKGEVEVVRKNPGLSLLVSFRFKLVGSDKLPK